MKYEIILKNDVGDVNEIIVLTDFGYESALTAALDSHYDDESEVYEIIIKRVKGNE